jgi:hypothetical protein
MSDLRVTNLRGRSSGTPPTMPDGAIVTGVATATQFSGDLVGIAATVGSATTITTGGINVTGIVTATSAVVGTANTLSTGGINVTGVSTVGILTVGTTPTAVGIASTTYLRGVVMHNTGLATATSSLYVYPSGVSDVSVGQTAYRLARVDLNTNETFFFEMNYPLVLTNQEKIVVEVTQPATAVGGAGIGSAVNFQILGDTV